MYKLPSNKLELLEETIKELQDYKKSYSDNLSKADEYEYGCIMNDTVSYVRRLARLLDMTSWNFNCFMGEDANEDFDVIEDEIKLQYIYECERRQILKYELLLEIAKKEAENKDDLDTINQLTEVAPRDIISDNGNKFKTILKNKGYEVLLDLFERTISGSISAII